MSNVKIDVKLKWNGNAAMKDFDIANTLALTESANLVQGKAKLLVHVDKNVLRPSIEKAVLKIKAIIGTNIEYAPHEEFGTKFRPAHPYLRPAFFNSIGKIKEIFKKRYKGVKYVK